MNYYTFRFCERTVTPLGRHRWVFHSAYLPSLGAVHWIASWMSAEIYCGHSATYHLNGHLVARTATYLGV